MTNEHMPGFVKVGYTDRTPEERLAEANGDTWSIPCWKCETSVRVKSPRDAEKTIHLLLSHDDGRVSPRREFFTCSVEYVKMVFAILRTQNPEPTPRAVIMAEVNAVIANELKRSVSFCEELAGPASPTQGVRGDAPRGPPEYSDAESGPPLPQGNRSPRVVLSGRYTGRQGLYGHD